tara:strand:- start:5830 stop:6432 length:603 start_codon:yes stop_codon:yes gene_type:complete
MLVSPKHKIVFVSVPKAGGSAISGMMYEADMGCYTHKSRHAILEQVDADLFRDYFKFVVVRNSYKLCASFYKFMTEDISSQRQEANGLIELLRGQLVVTEASNDWQISEARNPFPIQLDYFSEEGKILVDKIFIYDKGLDIELSDLKKQINFHGSLFRDYTTHYYGEYDWKQYYNAESVEYVKKLCQKDIEYFGFKFDEE